jgi:hypothetical protein
MSIARFVSWSCQAQNLSHKHCILTSKITTIEKQVCTTASRERAAYQHSNGPEPSQRCTPRRSATALAACMRGLAQHRIDWLYVDPHISPALPACELGLPRNDDAILHPARDAVVYALLYSTLLQCCTLALRRK